MFAPAGRITARAGLRSKLAALVVRRQVLAPKPGFAASEQRDFFRFLFWSQKRKASRENPIKKGSHRKVVTPAMYLIQIKRALP